jgi:hypothetical protein
MPERSQDTFSAVAVEHLFTTPAAFPNLGRGREQQTLPGRKTGMKYFLRDPRGTFGANQD